MCMYVVHKQHTCPRRTKWAVNFTGIPIMPTRLRLCLHEQPTSLLTSLLKNLSGWSVATRKLATFYRVSTRIFVSLLTSLLVVWGHENADGSNHFLPERAICPARQHWLRAIRFGTFVYVYRRSWKPQILTRNYSRETIQEAHCWIK